MAWSGYWDSAKGFSLQAALAYTVTISIHVDVNFNATAVVRRTYTYGYVCLKVHKFHWDFRRETEVVLEGQDTISFFPISDRDGRIPVRIVSRSGEQTGCCYLEPTARIPLPAESYCRVM